MCNVRMIRTEPGLVSIPLEKAVYCVNCRMVSSSARQRVVSAGRRGLPEWLPCFENRGTHPRLQPSR
jgi:hypothetical protein